MTLAAALVEQADRVALALAVAVLCARSWRRPALRPLALCLCAVLDLDCARDGAPPWLDVALYAAWYVAQALAVAVALLARPRPLTAAALAWWLVELARVLAPPALAGAALAAEWWALWAVATALQAGAVAAWLPGAVRRRGWPSEPATAALLVTAGAVADAVGPWAWGPGGAAARWEVGRWQSAVTWGAVAGASAWRWVRERAAARKKRTLETL